MCLFYSREAETKNAYCRLIQTFQSRRACRFDFIVVLRKVYLPRKIDIKFKVNPLCI